MGSKWKGTAVLLFISVLTLGAGGGCAGHTTKTTQVVTTEEPSAVADADESQGRGSTRRTVTTTTETNDRSPGIIGSAFRLVWAVISFPFRVIADLF